MLWEGPFSPMVGCAPSERCQNCDLHMRVRCSSSVGRLAEIETPTIKAYATLGTLPTPECTWFPKFANLDRKRPLSSKCRYIGESADIPAHRLDCSLFGPCACSAFVTNYLFLLTKLGGVLKEASDLNYLPPSWLESCARAVLPQKSQLPRRHF